MASGAYTHKHTHPRSYAYPLKNNFNGLKRKLEDRKRFGQFLRMQLCFVAVMIRTSRTEIYNKS